MTQNQKYVKCRILRFHKDTKMAFQLGVYYHCGRKKTSPVILVICKEDEHIKRHVHCFCPITFKRELKPLKTRNYNIYTKLEF